MKTKSILLLALFIPFIFTSCQKINGKGDVVTVSRNVTNYSEIELAMSADVYFSTADDYSLIIQAQENICDNIETHVSGSKLIIKVKDGVVLGSHDPIKITVTAPVISKLDISGSGSIFFAGTWYGVNFETNISGSGNIEIVDLVANSFKCNISGSGNIDVKSGVSAQEELVISGSGKIEMRNVVSDNVDATISGSGSIYINVQDLLDATISGSGNVYYYGTPVINTHISGSGNIIHL